VSTTQPTTPAPTGSSIPTSSTTGTTAPTTDLAAMPTGSTTAGPGGPGGEDRALDAPPTTRSRRAQVESATIESSERALPGLSDPEGFNGKASAMAAADESASFVLTFPWDHGHPIGVKIGPGRVLGAWVIWMTITLLIMAFWVPSPTRRASRATVSGTRRGNQRS
jgi:hypothetical protein